MSEPKLEKDPKTMKLLNEATTFMHFILRHTAIVNYRFNVFFAEKLGDFSQSMNQLNTWYLESQKSNGGKKKKNRKSKKMKEKKEKVEKEKKDLGTKEPGTGELVSEGPEPSLGIDTFKVLTTACATYKQTGAKLHCVPELMDLFGKMCGLHSIAGNLFRLLKNHFHDDPESVEKLADVEYYFRYWSFFCDRNHQCHRHKYPVNLLPPSITPAQASHIVWPLVVRTSLYCSAQFIKDSSELLGVDMSEASEEAGKVLTPEEEVTLKKICHHFKKKNIFDFLTSQRRKPSKGKPETKVFKHTEAVVIDTILLNFPNEI